jgi:hypothetical protein
MAVTINGTNGITFNDATTQASAVSTAYGGIGSYVMAGANGGSTTAGSTYAGSTLVRNSSSPLGNGTGGYILVSKNGTSLGLTGTWRSMTTSDPNGTYFGIDLFVRIA